jgi:putative heme-binding domain-containing protein
VTVADAACPAALRQQIVEYVLERKPEKSELLAAAMKQLPARLQTSVSEELAGSPQGAEALLNLLEKGIIAGRLSQNQNITKKIDALKSEPLKTRLTSIAQSQPPANQQLDKLIADRRAIQDKTQPDLAKGQELFKKHCAVCHQVKGQGQMIAPNLDGIGQRGLERVLEDVLDPNRNVDVAFRTGTLALDDGRVLSVLVRREEGETLVVVDAQGKESQIPKADIERRSNSSLSLMPANVAEIIPPEELPHLIGFLLEQKAKQP